MEKKKFSPYIFLGPVITLSILLVLYALAGLFPFGNLSTAFIDGIGQYVPFLAELTRKIQEGGSLLFSWHGGFGVNFWINIGYYLSSPFNAIALFFEPYDADNAFTLITLIKPVFMALTFSIFLKYRYNKNDVSIAIFSVLWSLIAYTTTFASFVSWIDSLIYFPLVILGIYRITEGKSGILYTISLAMCIVSNFYIGWMVCIFSCIYLVYCFISNDEVKFEKTKDNGTNSDDDVNLFSTLKQSYLLNVFFRFLGSSVLSGALSAIVLIPMANGLANTIKGRTETDLIVCDDIWGIFASHITPIENSLGSLTNKNILFVFCGIGTLILAFSYFFMKGVSVRKKVVRGLLFATMWCSIAFFPIYTIWHGFGVPAGFMHRFIFIYSFILLCTAFETFTNIKRVPLWGFIPGFALCALCVASIYCFDFFKKTVYSPKYIAVLSIFILLYLVLFIIKSKKETKNKVLAWITLGVTCAECVILNYNAIPTIDVNQIKSEHAYVDRAKEYLSDGEFMQFRKKDDSFHNTAQYGMYFGYNEKGYYSSMADNSYMYTENYMGTSGNGFNSSGGSQEQTPLFNTIYPIKYYLDGSGNLRENALREQVYSEDGYTLFKNKYTLPFIYTASNDIVNWKPFSFPYVLNAQNEAFKAITGTKEDALTACTNSNLSFENCNMDDTVKNLYDSMEEGGEQYNGEYDEYFGYLQKNFVSILLKINDVKKPAYFEFETTATEDGIMYIFLDALKLTECHIEINGREYNYNVYGNDAKRTYELGEVKKGDVAKVRIGGYREEDKLGDVLYSREQETISASAFTVNMDKFEEGYNKLDAMSDTEMLEFEDTYVKAKVTSYEDGVLYIPTTDDPGWKVYIDGVETPRVTVKHDHHGEIHEAPVPSHILMTEITKGEHIVEMKYMPKGFVEGAVITGVSVAILIAWGAILLHQNKKEKAMISDSGNENGTSEE